MVRTMAIEYIKDKQRRKRQSKQSTGKDGTVIIIEGVVAVLISYLSSQQTRRIYAVLGD